MDAGFNFGNVRNASVRVYDSANNSIICQYQLSESFGDCDSLIIGRMYRTGSEWEFEAMGQAYGGGLGATVELYS
jgi:tellurium resistance protein TerD